MPDETHPPGELKRGLGLVQATSLNVANMVGIGPFITIPAFLATMNGPQALLGWILAAVLVLCDGLVWSELGAAIPGSGGTYHFLRVIYGRYAWGRILPFLFIWQFLVSGTLEMASGYIGTVNYLSYAWPELESTLVRWGLRNHTGVAAAVLALFVTLALCRDIRSLGKLGVVLCTGTVVTVLTVIVLGVANFNPSLLRPTEDAFHIDAQFLVGLGAAMTIACYDYFGYYNICHLGDEVVAPARTIPRAVIISVVVVAAAYLTMNVAIIGVVPWESATESENIAADFMETLFGRGAAVVMCWMIIWTALACMFAITLGYSRIPYAAARNGDFFRPFAALHPTRAYPHVSLWTLGALVAAFCFIPLDIVISAAVTVRIVVQFIGQIVGLHLLRLRPDGRALPFRMWLYPLPSLVALVGWLFILIASKPVVFLAAVGVLVSGCVAFLIRELVRTAAERGGAE
jgi:amino acid transporter